MEKLENQLINADVMFDGLITAMNDGSEGERERNNRKKYIQHQIRKALEIFTNMPEALMQMGKYYYRMIYKEEGYKTEAIKLYSMAIKIKHDYAAAFNNRGIAYYAPESFFELSDDTSLDDVERTDKILSNFDKAIADLTEALSLRPNSAIYYLNRGSMFASEAAKKTSHNLHEKAIADFSNAIKYSSDEFNTIMEKFLLDYMAVKNNENVYDNLYWRLENLINLRDKPSDLDAFEAFGPIMMILS